MIRLARAGEAPAIAALVDEAYGHYVARLGRKPGPMTDDYAARVAAGEAWVLEDGEDIAGVLVLLEETPGRLMLDNIALRPAAQGRGFGRMLMEFVEAEARRRGRMVIDLYTHVLMTENQARYQHLGYVETHRSDASGLPRVYMSKQLA